MKWLLRQEDPHRAALLMIGAKPGDRIAVLGAGDAGLAAALARAAGLNGRLLVVDRGEDSKARVDAAAAEAGALVEFAAAPDWKLVEPDAAFELAVLEDEPAESAGERDRRVSEAARIVRPGGRIIAVERGPRRGWLGRLAGAAPPPTGEAWRAALAGSGALQRTRVLGTLESDAYVEAVRPR